VTALAALATASLGFSMKRKAPPCLSWYKTKRMAEATATLAQMAKLWANSSPWALMPRSGQSST